MATANGVIESEISEETPATTEVNGSYEAPASVSPQKQENGVPTQDVNGKQSVPTQIKESHGETTLERKSRSRETEKDRTNLYLRGLPQQEDYSEADLMSAFHPFGKVVSVKIMTERNPNTSGTQPRTGIGFVRFNTEDEARNALVNLNSKPVMIKNRPVRLEAKYADKQASNIRNSHNTMQSLVPPHVGNNFLPHHMSHKLISYTPYTGGNVQELMYFQPEIQRQVSMPKSDIDGITRSTECLNLEDQKKGGRIDGSVALNPYNSYAPNQWSGNPQARFPRRPKVRYQAPCVGPSMQLTNQRPPHPSHMPPSVPNPVNTMRNVAVQQQNANKNERTVHMAIPTNYVDPDLLNNYQLMAQQARRHPDAQSHAAGTVVMPQTGGSGGQYVTGYSTAVSPPQFYPLPPQNNMPCNQGVPVYYSMQHANGGVDGDQSLQNPGMGQPLPGGAPSMPGQSYNNMVYSHRAQPQAPVPHAQSAPPPHGVLPHMPTQSTHWNPPELVSGPQGSLPINGLGRHGGCQLQQPPMAPHPSQQSYGPPNGCMPFQVLMPGSRVYQTMPYPAAAAAAAVAAACPPGVVHQQPQLQQVACLPDFGNPATAVTHSQLSVSTGPTVESVNGPATKS